MGLPQPASTTPKQPDHLYGTLKTEAYVPDQGPPYEVPIDLRFPLHRDTTSQFDRLLEVAVSGDLESSQVGTLSIAFKDARLELLELNVVLYLGTASYISHNPGRTSPPYFRVDLDEHPQKSACWREVHPKVVQTINKYFHIPESQQPVIRYVEIEKSDFGYYGNFPDGD